MVRRHPGKNSRVGIALLATVACTTLWSLPGLVCGQTAPAIDQGEATAKTADSVTIDWALRPGVPANAEVTIFYGSEDGGTKESDWQYRADLVEKGKATGDYQVVLQDLGSRTAYVYRIRATGPAGATWSETATFETAAWKLPGYVLLLIVVALLVVPFYLGSFLAKRFRMPDHGWRIGLVVCPLACGLAIVGFGWPPKLGIDLSGGTILVYEVDPKQKDPNKPVDMDALLAAVSERVNPGGQKEMTIRPYGAEQIEIIIPWADAEETKRVEKIVSRAGTLEFRILANTRKHAGLIKRGFAEGTNVLTDARGNVEARWVPVQVGQERSFEDYLRVPESRRDVAVRETVRRGQRVLEVLVVTDLLNVDGRYLVDATRDYDQTGSPEVAFQFNAAGGRLFGRLTSENLPDEVSEFYCKLGIILDGNLYSAPRIKSAIYDRGVIEMGTPRGEEERRNQTKEVDDLVRVLNAGSLPAALSQDPISRLATGPTLGHDTIVKGCWAVGISTLLVVLFTLTYYRFAGMVACAALLMNLVLTVAIMIVVGAAFTLPGLAGLALTLGMAVDGNILVFERIREELARGAALRMAIRNGFSRATSAIVDSNLTTVITGIILYVIGTDQVKGFAITLNLGVLISMFTAVFCSHVVFDVAERRHWITKLRMMQFFETPQIDFLGMRYLAIGASLVVIAVGLVAVTLRGLGLSVGLLDIDFTGGVSVVGVFDSKEQPPDIAEIRKAFSALPDLVVKSVHLPNEAPGTWFQVDSSQSEVDNEQLAEWAVQSVRQHLEQAFGADAATKRSPEIEAFRDQVLKTLEMEADSPQQRSAIEALHQQIAGLFAAGPGGPQQQSARDSVRREVDRIARVNTAIEFVEEYLHQQAPGKLASNSMGFEEPAAVGPAAQKATKLQPEGTTKPAPADQTRRDLPGDSVLAMAESTPVLAAPVGPPEAKGSPADGAAAQPSAKAPADTAPEKPSPPPSKATPDQAAADSAGKPAKPGQTAPEPSGQTTQAVEPAAQPAVDSFAGGTKARLTFAREVSYDTVFELFATEFGSADAVAGLELIPLQPSLKPGEGPKPDAAFAVGDTTPYKMWQARIKLPPQQTRSRLESIQAAVAAAPYFPSSSTIGGTVAQSTRMQGIYALAAGMLCIIAYLWVRFQRVAFGLAPVLAVFHDVLVTLGAVAISSFVAPYLGFLMIDPFKIGLSVVVAFLTIIGYSGNDTIVIFDRIREVRGKSPQLTEEMVNLSINQTLSRTLLTTLTVLMVVVILYIFGGDVMHPFAFAMLVGLIAGTYSTVYIASPLLLWMIGKPKTAR